MFKIIFECFLLGIVSAITGMWYTHMLSEDGILWYLGNNIRKWYFHSYGIKSTLPLLLGADKHCTSTLITIIMLIIYWSSWYVLPKIETIIICSFAAIGIQHVLIRISMIYRRK